MKKKLVMRIASLALCVVFVGMLFGVPKAEAVAAEATAVAIGVAVLGSYVAATQLRFTGDVADTISNGISSLVSDWVEASAVAASADDWLANLGNTTQMTSPGILQMQGAFARGCAQFVEWLMETFGLDEDGDSTKVVSGSSDTYLYNGVELPDIEVVWNDTLIFGGKNVYPYVVLVIGNYTRLWFSKQRPYIDAGSGSLYLPGGHAKFTLTNGSWLKDLESGSSASMGSQYLVWSSSDVLHADGTVFLAATDPVAANSVSITRNPGFSNPADDAADDGNVTIVTGLTSPTLSDLAVDVPAQIAAGEFAPTVELTQEGEGAGEEVETPDDSTVVPGVTPWLQSIFNAIKGIADRIVSGIKGLFVPDQTAVDSLSEEVDRKLPIIPTLQGFGDDLVYKLQHPESCADGLGLTTVVDLGKGRGSYLGDTKHELLDVSWYLEYKPMVDDIIVGFCWLCFLWNCYGALPRIIHGEGNVVTVDAIEFPSVGAGSGVKELGKKK